MRRLLNCVDIEFLIVANIVGLLLDIRLYTPWVEKWLGL